MHHGRSGATPIRSDGDPFLALGIGINSTMFSLTVEFLFREPSCRDARTLAAMQIGGSTSSSNASIAS